MHKYNIGAGKFLKRGWVNIDNITKWYAQTRSRCTINYDLLSCKPLPIKTSSADVIYLSHVIEHVSDAGVQNVFNESYRSLKTKGMIRVTAPNIDLDIKAYTEKNRKHFIIFQNKLLNIFFVENNIMIVRV